MKERWWDRHRKKFYTGAAVAAIVLIPFGTLLAGSIYYKLKKEEDNESQ